MKTINFLILCALSLFFGKVYGQSTCPNHNIDFEDQHFTNWTGKLGTNVGFSLPPNFTAVQIDSNSAMPRHLLITQADYDTLCFSPFTNQQDSMMSTLFPWGGTCSVRLGNKNIGSELESLLYTFLVNDSIFTFHYASVLENPGHGMNDQPYFKVITLDSAGNRITGGCDSFYSAQSNIPFINSTSPYGTSLQYRRWSSVNFNLSAYLGQHLTIQFINSDCALSGHFGYTYLDVSCMGNGGLVAIDSVYPGDTNKDKICDFADLIPIGIAMGSTGAARNNITNQYVGQAGINWPFFFTLGANYKHSDCNGDGVIDLNDTLAISLNYGLLHPKGNQAQSSSTTKLQLVPLQTSFHAGDIVDFDIMLGDVSNPLTNYYGASFAINFPMSQLNNLVTPSLNTAGNWLGKKDSNCVYMQHADFANGNLMIGCTKTDHQALTGYGSLGRVQVKLADNLHAGDQVTFTINNHQIFTNSNTLMDVNSQNTTLLIDNALTAGQLNATDVHIFPNPANNELFLSTDTKTLQQITVLNPVGQIVYRITNPEDAMLKIDTKDWLEGLYVMRIHHKNNTSFIEKILVQH